MKTKCNFTIALTVVLAIAATGTAAWAASGPGPKECGLIGTWYGHAGYAMRWLGVHTAGSNDAENGEMLLNWVFVRDSLLSLDGYYGNASRMTPGHRVWEKTGKDQYR